MRLADLPYWTRLGATLSIGVLPASVESLAFETSGSAAGACFVGGDGNGGLRLPPGFSATIFADNIGHARHLVVAPNGVVYVNTWSGTSSADDAPHDGGSLVALKDTTGRGRADVIQRFGDTFGVNDKTGGTGIALYKGNLYADDGDRIVRYELPRDGNAPTHAPESIVSGLPSDSAHPTHTFVIDAEGELFVCIGSAASDGVWRYDANRTGQIFSPAERFAAGLDVDCIAVEDGIAMDSLGLGVYVAQPIPGRDEEELVRIRRSGVAPVAHFPARRAPSDFLVYDRRQFPSPYTGGAFIAFGSGNNVVFQQFSGGKPTGKHVVFAEGFAGPEAEHKAAEYRPSGLAVGPDGSLFIADDKHGRIWRITYRGIADAATRDPQEPQCHST